ncbi:hypothetical protein [Neobacillus soli]|uniref:hypothetical protein n=1 Tax=Neobacillus soli TaxID=220688 RepID=UPI001155890B|nr:hypothetical protein [Neobacillus soli]
MFTGFSVLSGNTSEINIADRTYPSISITAAEGWLQAFGADFSEHEGQLLSIGILCIFTFAIFIKLCTINFN